MELDQKLTAYIGRKTTPLFIQKTKTWIDALDRNSEKVFVNLTDKFHKALLGITGSGKSYGARIICEEIIQHNIGYGVIIVDPLGVYCSMKIANEDISVSNWNRQVDCNDIRPRGLDCEIWIPEGSKKYCDAEGMYDHVFGINIYDLSIDALCDAFKLDVTSPQINLLRDCRADFNENEHYDLSSLIETIRNRNDYVEATRHALIGRLMALNEMGILSKKPFNLHEMIKKNKTIVLDLSNFDTENSRLILNFLTEKLMKLRRKISRKIEVAMSNNNLVEINDYIPPIQLVIDEAHFFLENENKILLQAIKTGRNNGLVLTLISQSFDIPNRVLGNISQIFVGKMSMEDDMDKAYKLAYTDMKPAEFKMMVKSLQYGNFIYIGVFENRFFKFKFRPSQTRHPATTEVIDEERYLKGRGENI